MSACERVQVDVQSGDDSLYIPQLIEITRWVEAAVGDRRERAEVSLRVVNCEEGAALNARWRGRDGATNVLSFPASFADELDVPLLGDLVVCAPVVEREARQQCRTVQAHWAHMVIHGTLHLLGYDHIDESGAREMESLERDILNTLGFADPYQ